MKNIQITIVVPLHRMHLKNFDTLFSSLKNAEIENIKFSTVVVLNGISSKYGKSEVLENCGENNIKVIDTNEEMLGSRARNRGFKEVSTDIVIFLDADVIVPENFFVSLEKYLYQMNKDSRLGGLCPTFAFNPDYESKFQMYDNLEDIRSLNSYRKDRYINLLQGFCIIIKSAIFKELSGFSEDFIASEDRELALRVITNEYKIIFMPDIELLHINPSSRKNILKRKRWHAIGNAQLTVKYPHLYNKSLLQRFILILKLPFNGNKFDIHSYIYYWYVMGHYLMYFIYFKERFKRGLIKRNRY